MNKREIHFINATKIPVTKDPIAIKQIAAYCRVSHTNDDQSGSLETQRTYYTNLINENPMWENAGIYFESGTGCNISRREEFKKLLAKCREKKIDMIITKSISRFSRNTLDMLEVYFELRLLGIEIFFEKENVRLSDPETIVLLEILSAFAQEEIRSRSEDIKLGIRHGFENGTSGYRNFICYGYLKGKKGLEINKKEAEIVRMIFDLRIKGDSLGDISNALQKKKIPSPTGKAIWSRETLNKLLKNEKYSGDVMMQKTFVVDFISKKIKKNNGELPKVLIKNNHIPIISRETFELVQLEKIKRRLKREISQMAIIEPKKYRSKYALTEILVCGECNSSYKRVTWARNGNKRIIWRCISRLEHGRKYCENSVTIDEYILHIGIITAFNAIWESQQLLIEYPANQLENSLSNQENDTFKIDQIEHQMDELKKITVDMIKEKITEYDDNLVRKFIDQIKVQEKDMLQITFKNEGEYIQALSKKVASNIAIM